MTSAAHAHPRVATYADLEALPSNVKGEIIEGVLHTQPRPRVRHSRASAELGHGIYGPFDKGVGGPGGWWIFIEPGIELPGSPEVAPDIAGWRRERMPELPEDGVLRIVPDWVCEILSPSNRTYDLRIKFPFYAKVGVAHLWVVDTEAHTVEVKKLSDGRYSDIMVFAAEASMRGEPFEAVELALAPLWARKA